MDDRSDHLCVWGLTLVKELLLSSSFYNMPFDLS